MFEGLVANLLNRFLGLYVKNFDPKQLSIGIWNNEVKLRNLELRKEALDQLKLPLNVIEGHVGELTLLIPLSNLRGKPVRVNIEDVNVLAVPREDVDLDPEEERTRKHRIKMEKLESAELLKQRNSEGMSKEEQQKQQSFVASLTTAIVDNLQVTIKNIHIRYEDVISNPGHPLAAGLILHELSAVSTNDQWQPTFIQSSSSTTHKLAKLEALAVYWDTDAELIGPGKASGEAPGTEVVLKKFKDFGLHPTIHQYVLKPVSGQAGLEVDKTGKVDRPKVKARLFFDELGFVLDDCQYRDVLMLLDNLHYFLRHQETKMLQPKSRPMEDPRAWLTFAGKAVLDQIHDRNQKWSWAYLKQRRDDRIRYIELFKKRNKEEQLSKELQQELDALELKSGYEDLRFWRSLARNQLRKEGGVKSAASQGQQQQQKQSWSSWIWSGGSSSSSSDSNKQATSDEAHISEKDKDALYSVIDWDEKTALAEAVDVPKDTVKMQVRVSLQTGSFTLKRDPHGESTEILNLLFDSLHTTFIQRPTSSLLRLSLGGLRLYDGTTPNNLYPQTITVKDAPQLQKEERSKDEGEDEAAKNALSLSDTQADEHYDQAFFAMTFEQSPIDDSADSAVNVKLRGMEVVYNPIFVVEIAKFFKPPETHMESITALMDSAGEAVEGIRKQTRAGLEFALEEHQSFNVQLDLQTPLIIVPDSVVKESSICMILDAGHISANSELISKDTIREIREKQSQQYSDADYEHLEGLMYDKFNVKLESTQVLIGPNIKTTREQLQAKNPSHNLHVVERINIDFLVESCIVPKGSDLTKFRISGKLPLLHASFSDAKYKNLMKLIFVAIPNFDDDGSSKDKSTVSAQKALEQPNGEIETSLRPRSKSFQFSAQEQAILLDEEDDLDKQQTFEDTTQGHQDSDDDLTQRMFEFNFVVEKLQGSVFKSDADHEADDQLLAQLVGEHFGLQFYMRNYDMTAEVQLGSLALEDHVEEEPLPEFKNIVSSEDTSDAASKELLKVKYIGINKTSPEFMTVFEGIDTQVEVAVSTINVFVTRRTLLTLLDFVMDTFAGGDEDSGDQPKLEDSGDASTTNPDKEAETSTTPESKIRVKTELKRIALILNNDGMRLATLSLDTASVNVMILSETMSVGARLGNMSLVDDVNQGADPDSSLRQLLTIEGDNLADFTYDTFDAESETYPGYDSSVYLRSGSLKVNFVTEPFRKIMDFGVKFGKMQTMFAAARLAAANQQFSPSGKMQFDIVMRTPIVVFPTAIASIGTQKDSLTAYLGEVYAKNKYTPLDDTKDSDTANEFTAGIRNVRLQSLLHYDGDQSEQLELIEKVDLGLSMTNVEHTADSKRPEWEIRSTLSDVNVRITSQQLKLVMGLAVSIPQAFATESDAELESDMEKELPSSTIQPAKKLIKAPDRTSNDAQKPSQLKPELGAGSEKWSSVDLAFKAGAIGLELIQDQPGRPVGDIKNASLSRFSLNRTQVKARMISDGALESELQIESFTVQDTRQRETNKFRKIMSLNNSDISQQFMASFTMSGGQESNMMILLTIDSPRIILALDYILAVQSFVNAGLTQEEEASVEQALQQEEAASDEDVVSEKGKPKQKVDEKSSSTSSSGSVSFRVNLVDAQVVLLANPALASSEAVVLGMKQTIVTQQHALTLQVEKVGMFLCRMDKFDTSRLRILDDFSIATSHDVRTQNSSSSMINIQVDVEPLILRLSVRDVQMILAIVTKATSSSEPSQEPPKSDKPEKVKQIQGTSHAPSTKRASTARRQTITSQKSMTTKKSSETAKNDQQRSTSVILKREQANIHVSGIRVVLIGAVHELPILDWSVKQFGIDVKDWSGAMTAETSIDTYFNVYNFSKSAWEPLIEPWTIGFHMSQQQDPSKLAVELFSRKNMEATLTPATIALLYKTFVMISDQDEDVLSKPRRSDAPYRLRNFTGFTMNIWSESGEGSEGSAAKLSDGEEIPWRFEAASTTRETLAPEGSTGNLGMKLEGSGFDSVDKIPINREGETLYGLTPRQDKVLHRFLVEVKLGSDNIKYITFRSPLVVENNTQIPIELGVYSPEEGHLVKIEKIAPGDYRPAPVGAAFMHSVVVRPDEGFGYTWSNERLFWKDLLKAPINTITCKGEQGNGAPPFCFQMNAVYDKVDPLTKIYPYMKIRLSPPIELHNLLPYDFQYRIYDKHTKRDWTNFLRRGGISPGHVMSLSHLLLLSIDLQDVPFKQSDFAIVNTPTREYRRESDLIVKDESDLPLRLKLHYYTMPDTGGAFKVSVYSSHVVLNRTGLELDIRSKQFLGTSKGAAGAKQALKVGGSSGRPERAKPFMFSFPNDDQKNRALLKVGDSDWSKPQSLNAIGTQYSATVPSPNGKSEMQLGVSITQGEGKYNLTKVVTVTPRYLIRSRLKEDIDIREPGSSNVTTLKSGDLHPLRYMRPNQAQQLSLCFPGLNNQWSAPFHISNVGRVHVKLAKEKQRQQLIKVEILMEDATIFLHLSETEQWPFSVRNESDTEFRFYQANPNVDAEDEDQSTNFRAIRYRIPPRSIMPYAWDYPASRNKDLVLDFEGKMRHVKLAEIGPQKPWSIPSDQGRLKAIGVDVVADGPKQELVLSNFKQALSMFRAKTNASVRSMEDKFELKEQSSPVTMSVNLRLAGFGLSIINQHFRELLYVTFRDLELKYNDSVLYQTLDWTTKWIQIDNQLYGGIFPILLYPSVVPKTGRELETHPIFHAAVTRVKDDSYGVLYIKYATFLLQQMTCEIDEDFIFSMLEFIKIPGITPEVDENQGKLCDEELELPEPQKEEQGQDMYFELLHLQPIQIDLSFVRTERINAEDTMAINNPFMFAVNVMTMSLGNVNDAPLRYNALMIENARISLAMLMSNVQSHFVQESLRQMHIVLGSADFLGNPVGLFNNVSSGVADIFYEPYQGLVMTDRPQDLGLGIAKGASSFVKKSVFGFSDSMAKFTGSISKGLAAASLDKEYQDQRRMSKSRNRPKHALYGITSGGNAFANTMASGIGGLARQPLEGAEKEGLGGFVKGVGKGVLGFATKTALAPIDLTSSVFEGVRNTTTLFDSTELDRVRPTRFIAADQIVRPYSQREALGQFWLKTCENGKYFNEQYIAHLDLATGGNARGNAQAESSPVGGDMLVMLTYDRIMLIKTRNLRVEWDVPLKDIQRISKERTGMNMLLKNRQGPFLPISDESQRNFLYRQIKVAVDAYNDKWQTRG